jgi:hypothetical protein
MENLTVDSIFIFNSSRKNLLACLLSLRRSDSGSYQLSRRVSADKTRQCRVIRLFPGLCTNCARIITLELAAKNRFRKLLKNIGNKIRERTIGEDSGSWQAGGHRFDPGHVHQLFL